MALVVEWGLCFIGKGDTQINHTTCFREEPDIA